MNSMRRMVMAGVLVAGVSTSVCGQDWMAPVGTPKVEPLWSGTVPGALGTGDADTPTLTTYLPAQGQATGAGIVICPGGGYQGLAVDHEGHEVARWLTSRGIAAFILRYRLGPE